MTRNIVKNLKSYEYRAKPEKFIKYKIISQEAKHLSKVKKERDYYYYNCDYCGEEIRILRNEKTVDGNVIATGGIVQLPISLTNTKSPIILALCNKCLNPVLEQFEEEIKNKEMLEKNYNHIPRID